MTWGLASDTLTLVLDSITEFARSKLPDSVLLQLDGQDEMPIELVRQMCGDSLGLQLLFIPEEFGGMGGGAFDVYRICEALAAIDLGVATGVLSTQLGSDPIRVAGTPEQRRRWFGAIAERGWLMAYGATEPEAGSDLAALKTTAVPIAGGYRLNGRKQWISNGGVADLYSILANAPGGPTWFVVEKGTPGLTAGPHEHKHGIRASNTAALFLDDVEVPVDALVGGVEGQGLLQAQAVFGYTRLMVAAFGLGAGWAALDRAVEYSKTRIVGGSALAVKPGYTHKLLVPHAVRLEAARAYIEETAARLDSGAEGLTTEGAIAKLVSTEAGLAAAEAAIQALGGYGYTREFMVEKIRRDVRITTIYEGTSEIMEMTIARDRWQSHLKTRGDHYLALARELDQLASISPGVGAEAAALATRALAFVVEQAREERLTRNQHVLLRLGELMAEAECAGALVRRAVAARRGTLDAKSSRRFGRAALEVASRIFARQTALDIAAKGIALIAGSPSADAGELLQGIDMAAIADAQRGLIADMDSMANLLYQREPAALVGAAT